MRSSTSCARAPEVSSGPPCARHRDIERIFNATFADAENTQLCGGAAEPLYEPPSSNQGDALAVASGARIHYREDFAASALHEVAHWCIAGARRRLLVDYGYWYAPDGRDATRQRDFMRVEARPQALEWCFSVACRRSFRLSFDNVDTPPSEEERRLFARRVLTAATVLVRDGMPPRAERFFDALCREFAPGVTRSQLRLRLEELLP